MAEPYVTAEELKASVSMSGETYADADITLAVNAASKAIDELCRRRFWLDTDSTSVRYYTPLSYRLVEIDDAVDVVEVATGLGDGSFGTVLVEGADYILKPINAAADGEPYTLLKSTRTHGRFRSGVERSVRVTGQFGWEAVPDPIKLATSLLASRLVRRVREAPFGVLTVGLEGMAARIAYNDPDIGLMVNPYIRRLVA